MAYIAVVAGDDTNVGAKRAGSAVRSWYWRWVEHKRRHAMTAARRAASPTTGLAVRQPSAGTPRVRAPASAA
jgi:hypothetical protein